jgi:hypothetical protein
VDAMLSKFVLKLQKGQKAVKAMVGNILQREVYKASVG